MIRNLILDATALRDLHLSGTLTHLGKSGFKVCTTAITFNFSGLSQNNDFNFSETYPFIRIGQITENRFSEIIKLQRQIPAISISDCSVLLMASEKGYTIVTADPYVSDIAADIGLKILNYDGVLGNLVEKGVITLLSATEIFYRIITEINRLAVFDPPLKLPDVFNQDGSQSSKAG